MVAPGGSANVSGVLYQLLGAMSHVVSLRIQMAEATPDASRQTVLILEPIGGGGDIRVYFPDHTLVEQWKAKSKGGTWSFMDFVGDVLPDLYLSVDSNCRDAAEYRFVTEGRIGDWHEAYCYFTRELKQAVPDDPVKALDNTEKRRFGRGMKCTARELFLSVVSQLRSARRSIGEEHEEQVRRKTWCLLSRLRVIENESVEVVEKRVDRLLELVVPAREQIREKRDQLCGILLRLSQTGESTTPEDVLSDANLNNCLIDIGRHHERVRQHLHDQFQRLHYAPDLDVKKLPAWPSEKPILIIAGESGQGKTWQLCAVARDCVREVGQYAAVVSCYGGSATELLEDAADIIWRHVVGNDLRAPFATLPQRLREWAIAKKCAGLPLSPAVWVFVDDVQDPNAVRKLIAHVWEQSDVHLAITTSSLVGRMIANDYPEKVHLVESADFRLWELEDYLQRQGHDWAVIPPDVRETLRRPILAQLYCQTTDKGEWYPTHEYELYEKCWQHLADRCSAAHPQAPSLLARLAYGLSNSSVSYPWGIDALRLIGIDDAAQLTLESAGWLTRTGDGRVMIWHDRLLNWAVAKGMTEEAHSSRLSAEGLCQILKDMHHHIGPGRVNLGYVPMDVLWQLSGSAMMGTASSVLEALEDHFPEPLYQELIPTLGVRAIPFLELRLRNKAFEGNHAKLVGAGMLEIGRQHRDEVERAALRWISDSTSTLQEAALRILAKFPCSNDTVLDRIWNLHKEVHSNMSQGQKLEHYRWSRATFAALRAAVQLNTAWLERRIETAVPAQEPTAQLGYLLLNLFTPDASSIWMRCKHRLMGIVPANKPESLCHCISRYRDRDEVGYLQQCLGSTDHWVVAAAVMALARLDCARAIKSLSQVNPEVLALFPNWYFYDLLVQDRANTQRALVEIAEQGRLRAFDLAQIYRFCPNEMDAGSLNILLDQIEPLVEEGFRQKVEGAFPPLHIFLDQLEHLWQPELLSVFACRAGTATEKSLVKWVRRCLDPKIGHRSELKNAVSALFKIGGSGLTEAINAILSCDEWAPVHDVVQWSTARPDEETRTQLRRWASKPNTSGWDGIIKQLCLRQLANLGDVQWVVESLLESLNGYTSGLSAVLRGGQPFGGGLLAKAEKSLYSSDQSRQINGVRVLGLSGHPEVASSIISLARTCASNSNVRRHALHALLELGARDLDSVKFAVEEMNGDHRELAGWLLLEIGISESHAALMLELERRLPSNLAPIDLHLAMGMWHVAAFRERAEQLLPHMKGHMRREEHIDRHGIWGAIGDEDIQEWLRQRAFSATMHNCVVGETTAAIRALARFDPDGAFRAAEIALREEVHDSCSMPPILAQLDPKRSVAVLCQHMSNERRSEVRWAIGRALRGSGERSLICERLSQMAESTDVNVAEAAAELAGWFGEGVIDAELLTLAQNPAYDEVRRSAQEALQRRRTWQWGQALLSNVESAEPLLQWRHLEAVMHLVDPFVLEESRDELYLGRVLSEMPISLRVYVGEQMEKQEEAMRKRAEKRDREKEND